MNSDLKATALVGVTVGLVVVGGVFLLAHAAAYVDSHVAPCRESETERLGALLACAQQPNCLYTPDNVIEGRRLLTRMEEKCPDVLYKEILRRE